MSDNSVFSYSYGNSPFHKWTPFERSHQLNRIGLKTLCFIGFVVAYPWLTIDWEYVDFILFTVFVIGVLSAMIGAWLGRCRLLALLRVICSVVGLGMLLGPPTYYVVINLASNVAVRISPLLESILDFRIEIAPVEFLSAVVTVSRLMSYLSVWMAISSIYLSTTSLACLFSSRKMPRGMRIVIGLVLCEFPRFENSIRSAREAFASLSVPSNTVFDFIARILLALPREMLLIWLYIFVEIQAIMTTLGIATFLSVSDTMAMEES